MSAYTPVFLATLSRDVSFKYKQVKTNHFIKKAGEVLELRGLGFRKYAAAWDYEYATGTVAGYFNDYDCFVHFTKMLMKVDEQVKSKGIYFTLQVINPDLIARALNRILPAKETTSDHDVLAYRWLPIDLDPIRNQR